MQPFERLRYLARWTDGDDGDLVGEAADCLATFDGDPAGLVVACRRLLHHHPQAAPLWWLCARVLAAGDPADAAWEAWEDFGRDRTPARLATALPFPHDAPIAILGWPYVIAAGLGERSDLDLLAVRRGDDPGLSRRLRRSVQPVRVVGDVEILALEPTHLLVEAVAAGAGRVLVPRGTDDLARAVHSHGGAVWLVVGLGCALPERLFDALLRECGEQATEPWDDTPETSREVLDATFADRVLGPHGQDSPVGLARRADCPTAPELLRLGG
ncbi:MAG: hypothetical protein FJW88_05425 [Actinobacteria bacterium]|nr:hypothetical protein [Actinomycetota bacterium]